MVTLDIELVSSNVKLPTRAHQTDAGIDLTAYGFIEKNSNVFLFSTGIKVSAPKNFYVEIVPRSSIIKTDFIMANSVGIIDPDYRGEIFVPYRYIGNGDALESARELVGNRIAQLIVREIIPTSINLVDTLNETVRGAGGFGSTGN